MAIIDSVKLPDNSTYEVADNHSGYQKETLTTPLTINGTQETTVEGALGGLNDYGDALADNLAANENVYGAKNLITYPYEDTTKTDNGITFTDNGDGSVTVSGTASGSAFFNLHDSIGRPYLENGKYTLSGCPQFGGTQQMRLYIVYANPDDNTSVFIDQYNTDEETAFTINGSYGDTKGAKCSLYISIVSGTVISTPITFKPMIRDARIIDPTFAPYAMTNRELTEKAIIRKKYSGVYTLSDVASGYSTSYYDLNIPVDKVISVTPIISATAGYAEYVNVVAIDIYGVCQVRALTLGAIPSSTTLTIDILVSCTI